MSEAALKDLRILVAEDEYLLAEDLRDVLSAAGAIVVGPFPTVADAIACLDAETPLDIAILDVNLRGEMIFPVAELLDARAIPFIFTTGYQQESFPERFSRAAHLEKPVAAEKVASAIMEQVHRSA